MDERPLTDATPEERELALLWGSFAATDHPTPEETLMHVIARARRFDRKLLVRDAVEIVAGLFVVGVMGRASLLAPGWLPKVGALGVLLSVVYVAARLLGARRRGASAGAAAGLPLAERLRHEIEKVETQIELLSWVRRWYVLPLAAGATFWMVTLVLATGLPAGAAAVGLLLVLLVCAGLFAAVGWGVERLNRRAVEQVLVPYRNELAALLAETGGSEEA